MKTCTRLTAVQLSYGDDGRIVIDQCDVADISIVEDDHRFGFDADGMLHIEGEMKACKR